MTTNNSDPLNSWVVETLEDSAEEIQLYDSEHILDQERTASVSDMRRRGQRKLNDSIQMISLVERDGILDWESDFFAGVPTGRRRSRRRSGTSGHILKQFKLAALSPNEITGYLESLDKRLLKVPQGLREWNGTRLLANAKPKKDGYILLLVHGTFSSGHNNIKGIRSTAEGRDFLDEAYYEQYDQVLVFDHPTLSVSPFHNALDLHNLFRDSKAKVDVVSHSRGGLVTRWWYEFLLEEERCGHAVLVGSPLAGTGLAAPPNIRKTIKLLTNVSKVLGATATAASTAAPLLVGVAGLMRIFTSITSFAANTPLADAVVALVPGLNGQSMVSNNQDLLRLHKNSEHAKRNYYAITSDFEPTDPGWKFWKYFTDPVGHGANFAADQIFEGANDLVVDTKSMIQIDSDGADVRIIPKSKTLAFANNPTVHHLNYFEQPQTIASLKKWLFE